MAGFRRAVFFVLLLTVPFQAALGVSGLVCGAGAHHAQHAASTPHGHDGAAEVGHHHGPDALLAHHDVADEPGPLDPHFADAKCKVCGESCCGAAAIPAFCDRRTSDASGNELNSATKLTPAR